MSENSLQDRAKELGIKHVGVSKKNLEKAVLEAEKAQTPVKSPDNTNAPKPKINANTAIVRTEKGQEIRRYSAENHGKKFAALADEFASQHDYVVELAEVESSIKCSNCGHVLEQ